MARKRLDVRALPIPPLQQLRYEDEVFAREYVALDGDGPAAVRVAFKGYATKTEEACKKRAASALKNPRVLARIDELHEMIVQEMVIDKARVLEEQARIAFSDLSDLLDADGFLLPLQKIPKHARAAVRKVKYTTALVNVPGKKHDDPVEQRAVAVPSEVEFHPKMVALDQLSRHLGLYEADNRQKLTEPDWSTLPPELKSLIRAKLAEVVARGRATVGSDVAGESSASGRGIITH